MALKTFNLDAAVYEKFSSHCKENGISMSKKIDRFIREELERLQESDEFKKGGERPKSPDIGGEKPNPPNMPSFSETTGGGEHPLKKYC